MKRGKMLLLTGILTGVLAFGLPQTGFADEEKPEETIETEFTLDTENFQPITLEDDDDLLVQITGIDTVQDGSEYAWDIHLENRSSTTPITSLTVEDGYVNDCMCYVNLKNDSYDLAAYELAPGAATDGRLVWFRSDLAKAGAKEISEAGFSLYAAVNKFPLYFRKHYRISFTSPLSGATDDEIQMQRTLAEDGAVEEAVLLENEDFVMKLTRIQDSADFTVYYAIENKSDQKLNFSGDHMMLNEVSADGALSRSRILRICSLRMRNFWRRRKRFRRETPWS